MKTMKNISRKIRELIIDNISREESSMEWKWLKYYVMLYRGMGADVNEEEVKLKETEKRYTDLPYKYAYVLSGEEKEKCVSFIIADWDYGRFINP